MILLQYYSHKLLQSKYSFIIKLAIFLCIYILFYVDNINDTVYCTKGQLKKIERLSEEINYLKFENDQLKRHPRVIDYPQAPQIVGEETLDSLKQKIENYRIKNETGFLTVEERERFSSVDNTGVRRSEFNLGPEFFYHSRYEDVTNNYIYPYIADRFIIDKKFTDETGKEIFDLHKNYRWDKAHVSEHTKFNEADSSLFYDYTERYKGVYYPANHPDNNFNPSGKRLCKLIEREFYEKQFPDTFNDNCNIS